MRPLHCATSVVYAGSGIIGWVDLWCGILLCNALDEKPIVRLAALLFLELWKTPCEFDWIFENLNAQPYRHATIYNAVMRFVELKFHVDALFNLKLKGRSRLDGYHMDQTDLFRCLA
jgi:hypothetical protein